MNKLRMIAMCLFAMMAASLSVKAQEVTITLSPGWNWISVPLMDTLDFQTAMGTVTPVDGDIIKSHWGSAAYSNGQWRGTISQFYPGYGYHYKSNRTMPFTVTFTSQQPASQVIVTTAEPTDITTHSATCGGNVTSSNDFVILKGICWGTNPNPTFNDNYIEVGSGAGSFTSLMMGLADSTIYYVRVFAITAERTYYGEQKSFTTLDDGGSNDPTGIINSLFTINENGNQVYFSQGNLQYQASSNTWRFALNQWDYVGNATYGTVYENEMKCNNALISSSYDGWIDLFGWSTSGYDHGAVCYQPYSTSKTNSSYYAYGLWNANLDEQNGMADWGYNMISNGGNQLGEWRTLTGGYNGEWYYLFNTRTTPSGIRYAKACVNNVNGIILLPDNWNADTYTLLNTNQSGSSFSSNIISISQWNTLQNAGAVFLPVAGYREGKSISELGSYGNYWSSSYYYYNAYFIEFSNTNLYSSVGTDRYYGHSVRLVRDAE